MSYMLFSDGMSAECHVFAACFAGASERMANDRVVRAYKLLLRARGARSRADP